MSTHRAIRRLSAFQIVQKKIFEAIQSTNTMQRLPLLITWFKAFQANSRKLVHYTDGLDGCGVFFEEKLGEVFRSTLKVIAEHIRVVEDP